MHELNIVLAAVGGMVLVLGLISRPLKRSVLSIPLLALLFGIALGPEGLNLVRPGAWGDSQVLLEEAARITIAIGLMGVALRLPPSFPTQNWRSLGVLLALGMPLMWLGSSLLAYWILGLPLLVALLLGAVICPTDPIVASSIVTGKTAEDNLPERIRHTISTESGANDGMAYPIVMLPILLLTRPQSEVWGDWLLRIVLWEVGGAVLIGASIGAGAGFLLHKAEQKNTIETHSFLAFTLALTFFVLGAAKLVGTNGILAVFIAGLALDRVENASERRQEERVQEAVNQFFTLPIFTLLGATLPWDLWREWGWRGVTLAVAVILLRRLPAYLLLKPLVPQMRNLSDALFIGWFGPIGAAALFYAMLAMKHTGHEVVWAMASLTICTSLFAHGMTAAPFARWYGRQGQE